VLTSPSGRRRCWCATASMPPRRWHAVCAQAAAEHPQAFRWDGRSRARPAAGHRCRWPASVQRHRPLRPGRRGGALPAGPARALAPGRPAEPGLRRRPRRGRRPRRHHPLAGRGPAQHWAPETKVGHHFASRARTGGRQHPAAARGEALTRLVSGHRALGALRLERHRPAAPACPPRAHRPRRWAHTPVERAWWRTERQTFIPLPERRPGGVHHRRAGAAAGRCAGHPAQARALHAAIASMSPAVLAYRNLARCATRCWPGWPSAAP
jgi:hypothetical protein